MFAEGVLDEVGLAEVGLAEVELAEGGLGYGGGIITPGIARNATFAASITVDCRIHHCQNARSLISKRNFT